MGSRFRQQLPLAWGPTRRMRRQLCLTLLEATLRDVECTSFSPAPFALWCGTDLFRQLLFTG